MTIEQILQILDERGLDAYVVSHGNRFIGQDILESEHKLKHLCGFSGSAGSLIISRKKCFLLVDGRYELQAAREVDARKTEVLHLLPTIKNIAAVLEEKGLRCVGFDAWCFSAADVAMIKRHFPLLQFADIGDLVQIDSTAKVKVFERDICYAGESREEKLQKIGEFLTRQKADYMLLAAADSVSWALNIYARDLPFSPVVRAFALISATGEAVLFADNLQTDLPHKPLKEMEKFLLQDGQKILYDAKTTPVKLIKENMRPAADICQKLKAEKNETEVAGMKKCHIADGVAVSRLLMWLEDNWQGKTELDVVQKLHELRAEQADFFSESFATIAAAGENGAIVHYQPTQKSNRELKGGELLLLDSGGQYFSGTTDVTRTVAIGKPTKEQTSDFTLVLKAHIALARAVFPLGAKGAQLDGITRAILWQKGTDYKHGTGHGVACFGNVHEAPVSISAGADYEFAENVVVSDEPGVYKQGKYGIRIESLLLAQKAAGKDGFLNFAVLTKVPLDKRLIDEYMLSAEEREWLNQYHRDVYEDLAPYMSKEEKKRLQEMCSPL